MTPNAATSGVIFTMSRLYRIVAPALIVFALHLASAVAQQPASETTVEEKTLYQRLGGYDIIAAIVDEVGSQFAGDDQLRRFFRGHSKDSLARQRQLALDLVCELASGPCIYIGRDLKTAHAGLGVSPSDWERAMSLVAEALGKINLPARERTDFLALIATLEKDIVEK